MSELLKHFVSEHAFQDQGASAPNDNKYKCKWDLIDIFIVPARIVSIKLSMILQKSA
jgi:hypothetical protein